MKDRKISHSQAQAKIYYFLQNSRSKSTLSLGGRQQSHSNLGFYSDTKLGSVAAAAGWAGNYLPPKMITAMDRI